MGALSQKEKENSVNEVRILASITHPNIIGYKQAFFEDSTSSLCIVMEYAEAGDLMGKINSHIKNKTNFKEEELWNMYIQIVSALKVLHELKILHRDLKVLHIL
jgi:NIMA (never in mitosis gene a)-related kinase